MLRREQRRLGRAFTGLVCILAPCAVAAACDSGSLAPADGGADSGGTSGDDATIPQDDATPAADVAADTPVAEDVVLPDVDPGCATVISVVDASTDGDADLRCDYGFACGLPLGVTTIGCQVAAVARGCGASTALRF